MKIVVSIMVWVIGFLSGWPASSQVKILKILSPPGLTQLERSNLVLIDFWATWCGPCINVSKQLEVTQESYRDNLTIISLSNESEPVVQKFIDSRHPGLIVALDDNNQTFDFFKVNRTLPYGVLLNQQGKILWQGHPADLSNAMIEKYIRENRIHSGKGSSEFITIARQKTVSPKGNDRIRFSVKPSLTEENYFMVSDEGVRFAGKISELLSEVMKKPVDGIRIENDRNVEVQISAADWNLGSENVEKMILDELKLKKEVKKEARKYYRLTVKNPGKLWDERQMSLGDYNGAYMIGDETISVDNASVQEFAFRLSGVMDYPVYSDYDSPELHDWLVHYKFFDLTAEQLSNEYGIQIELKNGNREVIYFR